MIVAGVLLLGIAVLLFSQLASEQPAAPAPAAAKGASEAMATGRGPRSPVVFGLKSLGTCEESNMISICFHSFSMNSWEGFFRTSKMRSCCFAAVPGFLVVAELSSAVQVRC